MQKKAINPPQLFNSLPYGFSQVVVAEGKRTAYFSGQVAWDENKQIVGKDDFAAQVDQSLKNLRTAVELAGGTLANVVSLRIYIVQSRMAEDAAVGEGLRRYFTGDAPPVSTWIGVAGLANPDFLIEIEAIAVLD